MKRKYRMANTAIVKLTQQLKAGGCASKLAAVHAVTDVTGFGLMGQGRELAPVSRVTIEIVVDEVPHIEGPRCHPSLGEITPGLLPNRDFANSVRADETASQAADKWSMLLYDPQTLPLAVTRLSKVREHDE